MNKLLIALTLLVTQHCFSQYCGNSGSWVCNPLGGGTGSNFTDINAISCVDRTIPYNYSIQFQVPLYLTFQGQQAIDSVEFLSIDNLPCGLCWSLDQEDKRYTRQQDGCIRIRGKTNDAPGQYKLVITFRLWINGSPTGITSFPALLDGGFKLFLRVRDAGASCNQVDTTAGANNLNATPLCNNFCINSLSTNLFNCPSSSANIFTDVVDVFANSGCAWAATVTSPTNWLSTTSSGNGNGSVSFNVSANTSSGDTSRTATINIDGQNLTVTQPGAQCPYSLSQSSYTCPNNLANNYGNIVGVSAANNCYWGAKVFLPNSWLSTSSAGTGNGNISISVQANNTTSNRTGTIIVNGKTFTVTQPGIPCNLSLSQTSYVCPDNTANTYTNIADVTVPNGCSWSAIVASGTYFWLSTNSSGNGNGSISITVQSNTSNQPRTGYILLQDSFLLAVTQPGCEFQLSQNSYTCPNGASNTYSSIVVVSTPSNCPWSAVVSSGSSWLSTTSSDVGVGTISISVLGNNSPITLTGTIDVAGKTLTVIQPPLSTGISSSAPIDIVLSPNPANGKLFLKCSYSADCSGYRIRIMNTLGQQVLSQRLSGSNEEIDVSTIAQGLYVVQLLDEQSSIVGARQILLE
jgi:hypothetical protein